jgi:hypothetical protein
MEKKDKWMQSISVSAGMKFRNKKSSGMVYQHKAAILSTAFQKNYQNISTDH